VSRCDDPPDEILDPGSPGRRERSDSPESLPPLHIGEPSGGDDETAERVSRPRWWQWVILTVAVAAGLIVGVLGSNARRDAADLAAAESEVDLIAGAPVMVAAPDTPFQVPLYNAGALEVELLWIRPMGWTVAETATRHPIALPPNRWVPVRVRAIPDCTDFVSEDVVEMKVRTQTRERVITLPLPMVGLMRDVHTSVCRSFDQVGVRADLPAVIGTEPGGCDLGVLRSRLCRPLYRYQADTGGAEAPQSSVADPPAAVIFSFADVENACALTWRAAETSPVPRILTGRPARTAPLSTRSSMFTVPPSG
jgi:hypothetical protein